MVARRFTPKAVKQAEADVRRVATTLIDKVAPRGECEVVRDLAAPLPAAVIGQKLGFPPELWDKCREWSEFTMHDGGQYPGDGSMPRNDRTHDRRGARVRGRDDGASSPHVARNLATISSRSGRIRSSTGPTARAERMTDDELVSEALLVLDGGAETTRSVIGTMCVELIRHPDQRALLIDDPSILATTGVEEFIRWVVAAAQHGAQPRPRITSCTASRSRPATSCSSCTRRRTATIACSTTLNAST